MIGKIVEMIKNFFNGTNVSEVNNDNAYQKTPRKKKSNLEHKYVPFNFKIRTSSLNEEIVETIETLIDLNLEVMEKVEDRLNETGTSSALKKFWMMADSTLEEVTIKYINLEPDQQIEQKKSMIDTLENWINSVDRLKNVISRKNLTDFEVDAEVAQINF